MKNDLSSLNVYQPKPCLVIVIPCFNEAENVQHILDIVLALVNKLINTNQISDQSYVLLVDDGSIDETWSLIQSANKEFNAILRGIKLSRNFGHQAALLAGLHTVADNCDAVITMDADLQQDPSAIEKFLNDYKSGSDIVLGVRADRSSDGWLKKKTANLFYSLLKLMCINTIPNHADYRLLSRRALNALMLYKEQNIFLRAMCLELGLKVTIVTFSVVDRKYGETKYSLRKMLSLAIHGITSHSITPLRIVTFTGMLVFSFSFIMALYALYEVFLVGNTVPGWASTIIPIYFIGGIQILSLGIIGEYIAQIYSTVKNRPRWIIEDSTPYAKGQIE
jgi:glycosyltransferase involved in cell wall biosynthesis